MRTSNGFADFSAELPSCRDSFRYHSLNLQIMTASSSTTEMLLEAIEQGDSNRVRSILQSDLTLLNKPINGEMSTPLHLACSNENRFKVVRVLLSFDGVLVNTQDLVSYSAFFLDFLLIFVISSLSLIAWLHSSFIS